MYGPPPDPRQILAPVQMVDDPWSHLACILGGLALSALAVAWKRPPRALRYLVFIVGQVTALTAPLLFHINRFVYGSFPTIDKEGSLLFYLDGVHIRMVSNPLLSPADPAARLIGVHVGHLWVTQFFDLFLTPLGAFNAQAFLSLVLGWWVMWLLLRRVCEADRIALLLSFPFGMGLHVFRDLNWYTIEKAAIFWLPLFALTLLRAWKDGGRWRWIPGIVFLAMSWMNLYMGMIAGFLASAAWLWLLADGIRRRERTKALRRLSHAGAVCLLMVAPLLLWQWVLMRGGPQLGTPERFLWERAALDGFSLVPLAWNRLEVHRSLNLIGVGLALFGVVGSWSDRRVRFALVVGILAMLISVGPILLPGPVENPLYMAIRWVVPGFWRVAKPEVFFHITWMLMLCVASIQLAKVGSRRGVSILYGIFILAWLVMVRTHPAYPPMSQPINSNLSTGWQDAVFDDEAHEPDSPDTLNTTP
ncbi:MAG: hypothetical protein ACI8RZ_005928 [Myxococcota bacterium]|jgi:hypothetical protein